MPSSLLPPPQSTILSGKFSVPNLSIIILTDSNMLNTAIRAVNMGAFDYIEKPPDLNNLLTSVRSALKNTSSKKSKINPKKTISKYEIIFSKEYF